MKHSKIVELQQALDHAYNLMPKKSDFYAISAVEQAQNALVSVVRLLKHQHLIISHTNIKKDLLEPTLVSLKSYCQLAETDGFLSRHDKTKLFKKAKSNVRHAKELVNEKIKVFNQVMKNSDEDQIKKIDRINSLEDLAALFDSHNKNKPKEVKSAVTNYIDLSLANLKSFDKFRNNLPKSLKTNKKYEVFNMPVLVVPSRGVDFAKVKNSKIKFKQVFGTIVFEDQIMVAWKDEKHLEDAKQYLEERLKKEIDIATNIQGKTWFKEQGSQLKYSWMVDDIRILILAPPKSFSFPFSVKPDEIEMIDFDKANSAIDEILKTEHPNFLEDYKNAQEKYFQAEKDIGYFNKTTRSLDQNKIKGVPKEELPQEAFYEDYLDNFNRLKKKIDVMNKEYTMLRGKIASKQRVIKNRFIRQAKNEQMPWLKDQVERHQKVEREKGISRKEIEQRKKDAREKDNKEERQKIRDYHFMNNPKDLEKYGTPEEKKRLGKIKK